MTLRQTKYASSAQEWEDIYEPFLKLYQKHQLKGIKEELESHGFYAT